MIQRFFSLVLLFLSLNAYALPTRGSLVGEYEMQGTYAGVLNLNQDGSIVFRSADCFPGGTFNLDRNPVENRNYLVLNITCRNQRSLEPVEMLLRIALRGSTVDELRMGKRFSGTASEVTRNGRFEFRGWIAVRLQKVR